MIGTGLAVKSIVVLGAIGYVGGPAMANGAADVAASVIGIGSAATMHGVKQTGAELKSAQTDPAATPNTQKP